MGVRDFSRPLSHTTVEAAHPGAQPRVAVLVAHLKSKLPTPLERADLDDRHPGDADALGSASSTIRRAAEAAAARLVANEPLPRRAHRQYRTLRDVYYTYIHEGAHQSLDHILVSQHF